MALTEEQALTEEHIGAKFPRFLLNKYENFLKNNVTLEKMTLYGCFNCIGCIILLALEVRVQVVSEIGLPNSRENVDEKVPAAETLHHQCCPSVVVLGDYLNLVGRLQRLHIASRE